MCDTFAAVTTTGALFAKSSDRPPDEVQVIEWHPPRRGGGTLRTQYLEIPDAGAYGAVLSRPTWLWGAEHGVNEHGLAVGNERVWSNRDLGGPPALIGMDLVRLTLERARDASEGVDVLTALLERHGQGGSGVADRDDPYDSSFLLCDPEGGWVVETRGRDWVAAPFADHAAVSNRYTLGARWTRAAASVPAGTSADDWHLATVDTRLADHRLAVTAACATRSPGPHDAVRAQRHHGRGPAPEPPPAGIGDDLSGVTVCMHLRGRQATTAAMVATLPTGAPIRGWACLGSPCVGIYLPFALGAVPPFLTDPAQWARTAALRDRVEADPGALAPIRAALDPLEAALWEEAAALAAATLDTWRRFGCEASARADAALTALGV